MKKYNDFVFEELNIQNFINEYNYVSEELEKFWSDLEEKLEIFGNINSRNDNEVLSFNQKKREERKKKPESSELPLKKSEKPSVPISETPEKKKSEPRPLTKETTEVLIKRLEDPKWASKKSEIEEILSKREKHAKETEELVNKVGTN